ncbi:Replication factor C subunit 2, partial [Durusdinium trenchii]
GCYVVVDNAGDNYWCGDQVPKELRKLLTGREQRRDVSTVAFTKNDFVVSFVDGGWESQADEEVTESLHKAGKVLSFSFGPGDSYVLAGTKGVYWRSIPRKAERVIESRSSPLVHAALGARGAFYLEFKDGNSFWGGEMAKDLEHLLGHDKRTISKFSLSATEKHFFVLFSDQSYAWSATQDFCNLIDSNGMTMDPQDVLFSTDTIGSMFKGGRSIYETAEALKSGSLNAFDVPAIRVVQYRKAIYTLDNRRLWAFSHAGVSAIPVIVYEMKKKDTRLRKALQRVNGLEVRIRDSNEVDYVSSSDSQDSGGFSSSDSEDSFISV